MKNLQDQKTVLLKQLDQLENAIAELESLEKQKAIVLGRQDAIRQQKAKQQQDYDALLAESLAAYQLEQAAQDDIVNQVQQLNQQIAQLQQQYDQHAKAKVNIVSAVKSAYVNLKSLPYSLEGNSQLKIYLINAGFADKNIINYVCR